jgi:hypothetical protein
MGCIIYNRPSFKYETLNPYVLPKEERFFGEFVGRPKSTILAWNIVRNTGSVAGAHSVLREFDQVKEIPLLGVGISFIVVAETSPRFSCIDDINRNIERKIISLSITAMDKNALYTFDIDKVSIGKNEELFKLDLLETDATVNNGIAVLDTKQKVFKYSTPFVCKDLDGINIFIDGLKRNDEAAPPLNFRLKYKDSIKQSWGSDKKPPSKFRNYIYDVIYNLSFWMIAI